MYCRDTRLIEHGGDLEVRQPHFYPGDDEVPLFRAQTLECGLVTVARFLADRQVERRMLVSGDVGIEWVLSPLALVLPGDVADAVPQRRPDISLKGSFVPRFKRGQPFEYADEGVLNQVVCLEGATSSGRYTAVSPALPGIAMPPLRTGIESGAVSGRLQSMTKRE